MTHYLIKFTGSCTTDSPLAVSMPSDQKNKTKPQMFPRAGGLVFYPATGLLGTIRRSLVRDVLEVSHDRQWSAEAYVLNSQGGINPFPSDRKLIPGEDRQLRDANPIESLFGSIRMGGRVGMGNLYSELQDLPIQSGVRTQALSRDKETLELLAPEEIDRLEIRRTRDRSNSTAKTETRTLTADLKKQLKRASSQEEKDRIREQINEAAKQEKEKRKGGKSAVSAQNLWVGYEFIPAETSLTHKMHLSPVTPAEIGYFLASLRAFAAAPRIGGHAHHNCGWTRWQWEVSGKPSRDSGALKPMGRVEISLAQGFVLTDADPLLSESLAGYDQERDSGFSVRDFTDFKYHGKVDTTEQADDGEAE